MVVLTVDRLFKKFPARKGWFGAIKQPAFTAVDGISFSIKSGEILGLLGPNGAGKTTTIQMLLSTLKPTSGSITYFGKNFFTHRSEILQQVGFASTYVKLPPRLSILTNLDIYGRLYGIPHAKRLENIERHLRFFGMWDLRNREVGLLSAGETTRVMIAKAFMADPKIILLDEPTAALDPDVARDVRQFMLYQRENHGVSFLVTSHNMDEVTEVCDRVLFLKKGKIIADNTPWDLAADFDVSRVHLLVGDGMKRTVQYASEQKLPFTIEERWITIEVDEKEIATLLNGLARAGIEYSQISIDKPTLEDYFLYTVKEGNSND